MVLLSALLAALAAVALLRPRVDGRLERAVGQGAVRDGPGDPVGGAAAAVRRLAPRSLASPATAACLLAGVAVAVLVAPPVGPVLGVAAAVAGPRMLARLEPRSARDAREQLLRDLPLVLDLLASCLVGGAPLPSAAGAVALAVGGPAGARLAAVGAALAVGAPPAVAWGALAGPSGGQDDPLGPAARALARAADGGAPVAAAVSRLAAEARAEARSLAEQAARRVGVLAVAPLGLCFLPAFVLLGVVPVAVGLAAPLLATF